MRIPVTQDGAIADGGVPFVVSYRKILRKPKIKRERRFVGAVQLVKNLLVKAIETVEQAAFETTTEYVEPGESVVVHWAVDIEDPFDTRPGQFKNLVAYRMENDVPPHGLRYEVLMPQPKPAAEAPSEQGPQTNLAHDLTPEQFELLRRRQAGEIPSAVRAQQEELLRDGRTPDGKFRRPPAQEYGPRPVKTLDEELAEEGGDDEEAADLDGASLFSEDN